ncbi:Alpha/Beta hydrolase protein [Gymnopilus junonius]|uniref:Alpha/Beta hydrolase protein n=1 Tax=Gymnopilus junonius TaxID=109634 RepID=A0A9P5TNZ9_GYMJU|nr:Alpha/Beta hydrolase protein [Gymnopilus junonius]
MAEAVASNIPKEFELTDTQGFVARDDNRKEIVIALRGSASTTDILLDAQVILAPFIAPGVKLPGGAKVHSGFLLSWDALSVQAILVVGNELEKHPEYSIVTTGHSLGGSIALLAAVTLQQNFKTTRTRTYSYGAPRTGNKIFSDYVNATFGENAHRVVHGNDGPPSTAVQYVTNFSNIGVEYWQYTHPESEETTKKCDPEGEDPTCSACIPSQGITLDHTNVRSTTAFLP